MRKDIFLIVTLALLAGSAPFSIAREQITKEKEAEIRRMLQLTGMEKLVEQMKSQMITALRGEITDLPDPYWEKFQQKLDVSELVEKIVPLYDKYYSLEDLKAVNAFYASEVGQRVLATAPKLMKESMEIGMEWGKRIGAEAEKEARAELKKRATEKSGKNDSGI